MRERLLGRLLLVALGAFAAICALTATSAIAVDDASTPPLDRDDWSTLETGAQVYRAACSTCHGLDGTGGNRALLAFDPEVPDFTDCSFASREPHADWFAIAHNGGPTRGFDPLMPAFGGAISDEQLDKAATHVKSFCEDDNWPDGAFNLPRPLVTGKAFPEDEYVVELESTVDEPVVIQAKLVAEKRLGARNQIEIAVPVVVRQVEEVNEDGSTDLRWGEGVGDVALGWKGVLWHWLEGGTIGSLAAEVFLPLGDEADGIGKGIFRFEPFLAIGQIIPGDNFVQLQGGAELSTDLDVAAHEIFWRGALGHTFTQGRFGRAWSPMVEVVGGWEVEDDAEVEWSLVPELHVALNQRQHVMLVLGAEIPVTRFEERQITVMLSLLWDWFDGGFTEGW